MTTYYERKEATETPKESGLYLTNLGWCSFAQIHDPKKPVWVKNHEKVNISEWLLPIPSPIPSMTLEEAKHAYARSLGYGDWAMLSSERGYYGPTVSDRDRVSELYLQHNTLSLKQELEELKESCVKFQDQIFELENNPDFKNDTHKQLEQQVKTLTEALEKINGRGLSFQAIHDIAETALNGITK